MWDKEKKRRKGGERKKRKEKGEKSQIVNEDCNLPRVVLNMSKVLVLGLKLFKI